MNGHISRNYLRSLRKKLGLTQKELAFVIGYESGARICALESGRVRPNARELMMFARLFGQPFKNLWPNWSEKIEIDLDNQIRKLIDLLQGYRLGSNRRQRRIKFVLTRLEFFLGAPPKGITYPPLFK
jgi:transcriptional regulator with XRE-family HTH domain